MVRQISALDMNNNPQTEVLFYHLERMTLERLLPALLEKSLERGWRVVVQAGSQQRIDSLNTALWTYRDNSFLPHGTGEDGDGERQPIYLTYSDENPNSAQVRFFVDGADLTELGEYERAIYIFDGADGEALTKAREAWKTVRDGGLKATYWQQNREGRWQEKASAG